MSPPLYSKVIARFARRLQGSTGQVTRRRLWYSPRGGGRIPAKAHETLDLLKNGRWDGERSNQPKHGDDDF
jgi:hypothetical protein